MEKNSENLAQAIARLPECQPPELLWDGIADYLDFEQELEAPISDMPAYMPPPVLWDELALKIEQIPELALKPRWHIWLKWISAALLLALFLTVGIELFKKQPSKSIHRPTPTPAIPTKPKSAEPIVQHIPDRKQAGPAVKKVKKPGKPADRLSRHMEVVDDVLILACQQADDPNYNIIETLCVEALPVCEAPQFKKLKAELDELSRAHAALKGALGNFADDPELVAQLVDIERSRTQILQQLITMI